MKKKIKLTFEVSIEVNSNNHFSMTTNQKKTKIEEELNYLQNHLKNEIWSFSENPQVLLEVINNFSEKIEEDEEQG